MFKFYEVLVYHCKDNVATVYSSLYGRKRLKHIGLFQRSPVATFFAYHYIRNRPYNYSTLLRRHYNILTRQICPYNKKWHIPSILCVIKLLCLQTVSNNYKNQYLKQTKYHKLNVVTALIRQNTFVLYKRETRIVTNDNH